MLAVAGLNNSMNDAKDWSWSWSQCYEMLHSCYQRLRPLTPHIWWQFNDWLDNLSWNFFYLKNWLLLKYFNWHRVWAALTGRCGHGSCFMTKYKTIFSIVFCAQPSSAQLCSGWVLHLMVGGGVTEDKWPSPWQQQQHHTSTLTSNSCHFRHHRFRLHNSKMKIQLSRATLIVEL